MLEHLYSEGVSFQHLLAIVSSILAILTRCNTPVVGKHNGEMFSSDSGLPLMFQLSFSSKLFEPNMF